MRHWPRHPRHRRVRHARPVTILDHLRLAPQPDIVGVAAAEGLWTGKPRWTEVLQTAVDDLSVLIVISAGIKEGESFAVDGANGAVSSI